MGVKSYIILYSPITTTRSRHLIQQRKLLSFSPCWSLLFFLLVPEFWTGEYLVQHIDQWEEKADQELQWSAELAFYKIRLWMHVFISLCLNSSFRTLRSFLKNAFGLIGFSSCAASNAFLLTLLKKGSVSSLYLWAAGELACLLLLTEEKRDLSSR